MGLFRDIGGSVFFNPWLRNYEIIIICKNSKFNVSFLFLILGFGAD